VIVNHSIGIQCQAKLVLVPIENKEMNQLVHLFRGQQAAIRKK